MHKGLPIKYPFCFQTLIILEFSRQILEKKNQIIFTENPVSEGRAFTRGWTGGRADMRKLTAAFRNFASVPYNCAADLTTVCTPEQDQQ
jgi:hypothetical protein